MTAATHVNRKLPVMMTGIRIAAMTTEVCMDAYCDGLEGLRRGIPPSDTRVPTYLAGLGMIAVSQCHCGQSIEQLLSGCWALKNYLLSGRSGESDFFGKFLNEFLEWLLAFPPVRLLQAKHPFSKQF